MTINHPSKWSRFRVWLFSVLFPDIHSQHEKLLTEYQDCLGLYIKTERKLSLYKPSLPVAISDERILERVK